MQRKMKKDTRKIIQALTYFASQQEDHELDNMKAYKLLWLADRLHLRKYGRFISNDTYYAMPFGPVPSDTKHLLENKTTQLLNDKDYQNRYIQALGKKYKAIHEPDLRVFSVSDRESLDMVLTLFNGMSATQLSDLSHTFPEWKHYQSMIDEKETKRSYPIDVDLFFEPTTENPLFVEEPEVLALTKELYHQYNRSPQNSHL